MAMGRFIDHARAARPAPIAAYHVCRRAHFIKEDQFFRIERALALAPQPARQRNIAAILFSGEYGFF